MHHHVRGSLRCYRLMLSLLCLFILVGCSSNGESTNPVDSAPERLEIVNGYVLTSVKRFNDLDELSFSLVYDTDFRVGTIEMRDLLSPEQHIEILYALNSQGDIESESFLNPVGDVGRKLTYTRDSSGRVNSTTDETRLTPGEGNLIEFNEYTYTNDLLSKYTTTYNDSDLEITIDFVYDLESRLNSAKQLEIIDSTREITHEATFSYDRLGQRIGYSLDLLIDGQIDETTVTKYDDNGNIYSVEYFSRTGVLTHREEFTYEDVSQAAPNLSKHKEYYTPVLF